MSTTVISPIRCNHPYVVESASFCVKSSQCASKLTIRLTITVDNITNRRIFKTFPNHIQIKHNKERTFCADDDQKEYICLLVACVSRLGRTFKRDRHARKHALAAL